VGNIAEAFDSETNPEFVGFLYYLVTVHGFKPARRMAGGVQCSKVIGLTKFSLLSL
jgi:hypothetical protein